MLGALHTVPGMKGQGDENKLQLVHDCDIAFRIHLL